jgi:hypothetical protein
MRTWVTLSLVIFAVVAVSAAQAATCQARKSTVVGHSDGITYLRTSLIEPAGKIGASVLVPDSNGKKLPGIVISHAVVIGKDKKADMLRLAWALSRAGAMSIVLDGTIISPVSDDEAERIHRLVPCAAEWLVENEKADGDQIAAIAPEKFWHGWSGSSSFCASSGQPCWPIKGGVGFPQSDTETIVVGDFRSSADFLRGLLKLQEIKPEWLDKVLKRTSTTK